MTAAVPPASHSRPVAAKHIDQPDQRRPVTVCPFGTGCDLSAASTGPIDRESRTKPIARVIRIA
jgi:hypothetical protein